MLDEGHAIAFVYTCKSEDFYSAKEEDFRRFAKKIGCPYFNDLRIADRIEDLKLLDAAVCISVNWMTVLPRRFLNSFPHGVLNVQAGDLPRYRGNACPKWAILNGEIHVGLSVHQMVEELDAGPILLSKKYELDENTYIGDVYSWLDKQMPRMLAAQRAWKPAGCHLSNRTKALRR